MKISLSIMVFLYVITISTQLFAEARAPQLVISAFVEALQKRDIEYLKKYVDLDKIKKHPKHAYSIKQLEVVFADVDVFKIEISKPFYDKKTKTIRVRLTKPLSFDFELQHQNIIKGKGDFYRIIGIHPRR